MPNHLHGLLVFSGNEEAADAIIEANFKLPAGSLGAVIRDFKSSVKRKINYVRQERGLPAVEVWQRGFHDHIVRDEDDLNRIRRYIIENPLNWHTDEHHPLNMTHNP